MRSSLGARLAMRSLVSYPSVFTKEPSMPASPFAAQMYTLREFTKTPADIAKSLARVRKIGYEAVQLSALGKIDPKELATILKNEGLAVPATHVSPDRMRNETQAVIDE